MDKPKPICFSKLLIATVQINVVLAAVMSLMNVFSNQKLDIAILIIGFLIYYVVGFPVVLGCGYAGVYYLKKYGVFNAATALISGALLGGIAVTSLLVMRIYLSWELGALGAIAGWLFWFYEQRFSYNEDIDEF